MAKVKFSTDNKIDSLVKQNNKVFEDNEKYWNNSVLLKGNKHKVF